MKKENTVKDEDFALQAVPESARKSFLSMFVIMMGFTFFSASMSVGGQLGVGLNMSSFLWAMIIGNAILGVYTALLGYVGCRFSYLYLLLFLHFCLDGIIMFFHRRTYTLSNLQTFLVHSGIPWQMALIRLVDIQRF